MVESDNVRTQPIKDPERRIFDRIDETLADYDKYVALDHRLAVEGLANEAERLTTSQNGDPIEPSI